MAMLTVIVPASTPACQVDFPKEGVERSVKGAIYVRPATTFEVTEEELAFIRKDKPALARQLIVAEPDPHVLTAKLLARAKNESDEAMKKVLDAHLASENPQPTTPATPQE
jgi:hypothetical protein